MADIRFQHQFAVYMRDFMDVDGSPVATLKNLLESNGHFEIPLLILSYIEYFGGLYTSKGRIANFGDGCEFVKKYFPPEYHGVIGLMFAMWRNGLAHEHEPKVIEFEGKIVQWATALTEEYRDRHLKIKKTAKENTFGLTVCMPEFIKDFERALESFRQDVLDNPALFEKVAKAFASYTQPEDVSEKPVYIDRDWLRNQLK